MRVASNAHNDVRELPGGGSYQCNITLVKQQDMGDIAEIDDAYPKVRLASVGHRYYLAMVRCSIKDFAVRQMVLSMKEIGMNDDFNIDHDEFARYIRDAERMRAEALRDLLLAVRASVWNFCVATGRLARSVARRRKWNLSVPAPHH